MNIHTCGRPNNVVGWNTRTSTVHTFDYTWSVQLKNRLLRDPRPRTRLPCPELCSNELSVFVPGRVGPRARLVRFMERGTAGAQDGSSRSRPHSLKYNRHY